MKCHIILSEKTNEKYFKMLSTEITTNLIGWKLEVGVVSYFIQHDKVYC